MLNVEWAQGVSSAGALTQKIRNGFAFFAFSVVKKSVSIRVIRGYNPPVPDIPKTMRAVVYRGVNDLRLETVPVPRIGSNELLVQGAPGGGGGPPPRMR